MITSGRLISRDFYDQVSQYFFEVLQNKKAFGAIITDQGNIKMDSVASVYLRLDKTWVLQGFIRLEQPIKLYGFYMVWTDQNNIPLYGVSVLLSDPQNLDPGGYTFRIDYVITTETVVGIDVPCPRPQYPYYRHYDITCPI